MKKFLLIPLILFIATAVYAQQSVTLKTYYPAPVGAYDRIRLVPRPSLRTVEPDCAIGTIYVDEEANNTLYFCSDDGDGDTEGKWGLIGGVWTQSEDNVYLTDTTTPALYVGIGTTNPQARLHVQDQDIDVDWSTEVKGGLKSTLALESVTPLFSLVGDDDSSFNDAYKLVDVDTNGSFNNLWSLWRGATSSNEGDTFNISYVSATQVPIPNWWSGEVQKMRIQPNGKVAIGTTDMASYQDLQIAGGGKILLESDSSTGIAFKTTEPGNDYDYGVKSSSGRFWFYYRDRVGGNHKPAIKILHPGLVGFGLTTWANNPETQLYIEGDGKIRLEHTSVGFDFINSDITHYKMHDHAGYLGFYMGTFSGGLWQKGNEISFHSNGSVGIGTTDATAPTPEGALHVWGQKTNLEHSRPQILFKDTDADGGVDELDWLLEIDDTYFKIKSEDPTSPGTFITRVWIGNTGKIFFGYNNQYWFRFESAGLLGIAGYEGGAPHYPIHHLANGAILSFNGQWTTISSIAYKENIIPLSLHEAMDALDGLHPVVFNYKGTPDEPYVGFIAEEVPDLVAIKDRDTLSPLDIAATITKVVQHQQEEMNRQKRMINEQQKQIDGLKARLDHLSF